MRRSWETDSRNCRSRARDRSRDTAIWLIERPSSAQLVGAALLGHAGAEVAGRDAGGGRLRGGERSGQPPPQRRRRGDAEAQRHDRRQDQPAAHRRQLRADVPGEDDGGDVPAATAAAAATVATGRAGRQAFGRPDDAVVGAVQDGAGAERGGVEVRGQAGNRVEAGGRGDRAVGRHEHAGGVAQLQRPAQHQDRAALRVAANAGAVRRPLPQRLEPAGQLLERGRIEVQLVELADEAVLGRRGGPSLGDDDGDEAGDHQRGCHDGDHDRA